MTQSFEDLMNTHGKAFDNTEASDFGGDLPDGQYIIAIQKCNVNQSKSSGRWQVSWDGVVVWDPQGSKFKNRHVFFHDGITKVDANTGKHEFFDIGVGIIKKRFKLMGFPNVTSDKFAQVVTQAIGRVVAVTQKTNNGFTNYYFDGQLADSLSTFTPPSNVHDLKTRLASLKGSVPKSQPVTLPGVQTAPQQTVGQAPPLKFEE